MVYNNIVHIIISSTIRPNRESFVMIQLGIPIGIGISFLQHKSRVRSNSNKLGIGIHSFIKRLDCRYTLRYINTGIRLLFYRLQSYLTDQWRTGLCVISDKRTALFQNGRRHGPGFHIIYK